MKRYILPILLFAAAVFNACEYETLPVYSGKDQVYFSYADAAYGVSYVIDSTTVHFGYDVVQKADTTVTVAIKVMGSVADYDRPVDFIIIDSLSTAVLGRDVELLKDKSFITANKATGIITVKLKNTENLNDTVLKVAFKLVENDYFKADYEKTIYSSLNNEGKIVSTRYSILFDNSSDMPNFWAHATYAVRFNMFFGAYSTKKFITLCELFHFDWDYFTYPQGSTSSQLSTLFNARFPSSATLAWARAFNRYLDEYEFVNGERLLEDNGDVMIGSPYYK
ncbi:MAG: DUF4843 domain-containing protein [Prevotellaceae bacterium]|jgi:hypothetical protein|nr:DUF4843 domain-containing protein [Prevotellaceae bacterium]